VLHRAIHHPVELVEDLLARRLLLATGDQTGEQPRVPERAAREHDRLRARVLPGVDDPARVVHPAAEDHGRVERVDELLREVEVGRSLVVDLRRARMERDACDARLADEPVGEHDAFGVALLLPAAQLHGDRQPRSLARGARDRDRGVVV
jgi:hypothetical protein